MALRTARRSALVDQVIAQLREQIAAGEWTVGERIPTETELVAMLGVGRNTVREGVRALAHAGLLEIRQGAGTFVRGASEMAGAVHRRVAGCADLREALEVRRALEVEAARLAAARRTDDDSAAIAAALEVREEAWRAADSAAFVEADVRLHRLIVAAAHNTLLQDLYLDIGDAMRRTLQANIGENLHDEAYVDHSRLVAAIAAGDVAAAVREASEYLDELIAEA